MSVMSLEDLLAEEGFKRRKPKLNSSRNSIASSEGRIKTLINGRNSSGPLMTVPKRTGRTRSDVPRYDLRADFPPGVSFSSHKTTSRNNEVKDSELIEKVNVSSSSKLLVAASHEITEASDSEDVVETGKNKPYKDIYLNRVYGSDEVVISIENDAITHRGSIRSSKKQPLIITSDKRSSFKTLLGDEDKLGEFKKRQAQPLIDQTLTSPALDELAVKAVVSILTGPAKNFLSDGEFRSSLRHNSFASLNFCGPDDEGGGPNTESKVVENLERAIEAVERAAEDGAASSKEVKRASLQLSVITGLGPKDGLTSGIPNSQLSACAHLYLGVIYAMQSKDGISSKHLLQVFRDSPRQARTVLLQDLWDRLFQPHLSHLTRWFETEANHLSDSSDYENDLRHLERAYDEALDSGTREIAIYYRDWISEGVEAPSLPIIETPSFSVRVVTKGAFDEGRLSKLSPQPMVSKRLYDEVFRFSSSDNKSASGLEVCEEEGVDVNVPEDKQLILYSHTLDTSFEQDHREVFPDDLAVKIEAHQLILYQETSKIDEDSGNNPLRFSFLALPPPEEDKSVINSPENRSIERKLIEESAVIDASKHLPNAEETENSLALITEPPLPVQEQKDYDTKPSRVLIPKDFLCPLTGLLFEEPVTLETGRTYERRAITEWFDKGYLTCPLTRKPLQCRTVPPVNPILKRVIDEWKVDHFSHLLALISIDEREEVRDDNVVCVLKQLLLRTVFSEEERVKNARRVVSIGGLHFLLRKFNEGRGEEKGWIFLPMILSCIEADGGCRDKVARDINGLDLLEMLRCDSLETRNSAVSLLVELVCMNRRIGALRFLSGLRSDEIVNALNDICVHLEGCPLEEKPLVSVLILHLDLLTEKSQANDNRIYYRQKAVDALTTTLEKSLLSDDELRRNCSRALLTLGGFFSKSGKLMTEDHMLKLAGFLNCPEWDPVDSTVEDEEEEEEEAARNMWLGKVSISLLGDGKKSFLSAVSKCLSLGDTDSIRVCLTTVAWLSFSLALLPDEEASEFRAYALSGLISPLRQCMEYQERVEHKVLASFSLLSFSKNQECRELMMEMGEEMVTSLENLAEVTWTAKELRDVIISWKGSYKGK